MCCYARNSSSPCRPARKKAVLQTVTVGYRREKIKGRWLNPLQRFIELGCLLHRSEVKRKGEQEDATTLKTGCSRTKWIFTRKFGKCCNRSSLRNWNQQEMVSDFSKNSKISASANPGQGFQRNTERPRAAPRTSRHASKDICLGLAVSWGEDSKAMFPPACWKD